MGKIIPKTKVIDIIGFTREEFYKMPKVDESTKSST